MQFKWKFYMSSWELTSPLKCHFDLIHHCSILVCENHGKLPNWSDPKAVPGNVSWQSSPGLPCLQPYAGANWPSAVVSGKGENCRSQLPFRRTFTYMPLLEIREVNGQMHRSGPQKKKCVMYASLFGKCPLCWVDAASNKVKWFNSKPLQRWNFLLPCIKSSPVLYEPSLAGTFFLCQALFAPPPTGSI